MTDLLSGLMGTALEKIKGLAASGGQIGRRQLMTALHNLAYSMEETNETVLRYGHLNLQTAAVKTGMDLGLFKLLAEASGPLTVEKISHQVGADAVLMNRLLRYLSSIGAVDEAAKSEYSANHITRNLSEKLAEAGVSHYFGTCAPLFQTLPSFLKKTSYANPTDELHATFQDTWNTPLHVFQWFGEHPEHVAPFNDYMAHRRQPDTSWLSVYPVREETEKWDASKPVFVNVGGGIGHQCAEFKSTLPDVPGRVILQDLPHSIERALPTPGVENMVHNFFEPQPVKGAKFYHMRGVLHNHPLHKVQLLLENTKSAMTEDSILLIDEMILPETGVSVDVASIDMTMMSAFASMERTQTQWHDIFQSVGLELVKAYTYNPAWYESVMDVRLREDRASN